MTALACTVSFIKVPNRPIFVLENVISVNPFSVERFFRIRSSNNRQDEVHNVETSKKYFDYEEKYIPWSADEKNLAAASNHILTSDNTISRSVN